MEEKNQNEFFETDNLFLASQKLRTHFGYHRLLNSAQKKFYFEEKILRLQCFSLFEFKLLGELSVEHYCLDDGYAFHFPITGYFLVNSGQKVIKIGPGQMFILSPKDAPHFRIPKGVDVLIIYIERKKLLNYAKAVIKHRPEIDLFFSLTDYPEEIVSSIRVALLNVLANSKLFTNQCLKEIYFKQAESYLLTLLLTLIDNSYSGLLKLTHTNSLPLVVGEARRFMLENIGEVIHLDDLCLVSNVSKRALIYQFKKHCGVTPMSYLLGLRLDMLREEIKESQSTKSILEMAMKLGLNHPGRLAKNYKERFGQLPSKTS